MDTWRKSSAGSRHGRLMAAVRSAPAHGAGGMRRSGEERGGLGLVEEVR